MAISGGLNVLISTAVILILMILVYVRYGNYDALIFSVFFFLPIIKRRQQKLKTTTTKTKNIKQQSTATSRNVLSSVITDNFFGNTIII